MTGTRSVTALCWQKNDFNHTLPRLVFLKNYKTLLFKFQGTSAYFHIKDFLARLISFDRIKCAHVDSCGHCGHLMAEVRVWLIDTNKDVEMDQIQSAVTKIPSFFGMMSDDVCLLEVVCIFQLSPLAFPQKTPSVASASLASPATSFLPPVSYVESWPNSYLPCRGCRQRIRTNLTLVPKSAVHHCFEIPPDNKISLSLDHFTQEIMYF